VRILAIVLLSPLARLSSLVIRDLTDFLEDDIELLEDLEGWREEMNPIVGSFFEQSKSEI